MHLLQKIRLSVYFVSLLVVFSALSFVLPKIKFESAAMTLFSVNSFLYGFYIAPILSAQKSRIEELHKIVRSEANALFAMALSSKSYAPELHTRVVEMLKVYVRAIVTKQSPALAEKQYESMISEMLAVKSKEKDNARKFLDQLVANQANRSNFAMQLGNQVFSNEWWIMLVLFSITLSFVLLLDAGGSVFINIVRALLCTGLTMLLIILYKLSTLSHKKAKKMWDPLKKLLDSDFYRLD